MITPDLAVEVYLSKPPHCHPCITRLPPVPIPPILLFGEQEVLLNNGELLRFAPHQIHDKEEQYIVGALKVALNVCLLFLDFVKSHP
jgi:hypothetical protein